MAEPTESAAQREQREARELKQAEYEHRHWNDDQGDHELHRVVLDVDGDSEPDPIEVRCLMSYAVEELTLTIDGRTEHLDPELSDMMGCYVEVVPDPGPGHQVWVTAIEHDEISIDEHFLFFYRSGAIHSAWRTSGDLGLNEDGSWEIDEEVTCDEDERERVTETTRYWIEGGAIVSERWSITRVVDPRECEEVDFDP